MKRSLRKAIAFVLALGMVLTGIPVSAQAAPTDETKSSSVTTLAETIYDEAVTFSDSVAFLQNGHWSDDGQSNISADTTIVFMDAQGNKTEFKNNDGNGNQLFDAIYPMISSGYHQYDAFKVIKDGKMSYIRADGNHPYYGESLQWYNFARPINDKYVVVSDDNETYRVLDADGKVVLDDVTLKFYNASAIGNCAYIKFGHATYVICADGQVKKFDRYVDYDYDYQNVGKGYATIISGENTTLLDKDGNVVDVFTVGGDVFAGERYTQVINVNVDAIESGYVVRRIIAEEQEGYDVRLWTYYDVWNLETDTVVAESALTPEFDGNVILGTNEDRTRFLTSVDGTTYFENLDTYVTENLTTDSYEEVTYSFYYVNGSLLISMSDWADGVETETYVLTKETAFADGAKKHLNGIVQTFSYDEEYVMTADFDWYIDTMATTKGDVVKEYGETDYGFTSALTKRYTDETRIFYDEIDGFPFIVYVRDPANNWSTLGDCYITEDGEVHKARELATSTGNFLVDYSISGEGVKVINTDNKVVYENSNVEYGNVAAFWYQDYFTVTLEGKVYLYDRDGNLVLGEDVTYAAIGNDEIMGYYPANDDDRYGKFDYYNETLENGICIVKVKASDGYKYGAVSVGVAEKLNGLQYDEATNTWYYYVDGKIATDYTGLVEYYGAWYYVENGVLNWGYTGLTLYYGTWYYVENGVLNWDYTGLTLYYGTWYYVENGVLNWGYTGLTNYYDTWYYVENGVLNWGYTGLTLYYGTWYYVEGGVLNWGYTGLVEYYGAWYYVEGGVLNWGYTGLVNHYGAWYYVEGGVLNWGYTGLVYYYGTWYYVGGGVLDWSFTGTVEYGGSLWYVENGIMVGPA